MSALTHSGGCQCGAVRYTITGEILYPHVCHCRMCQKASGNYALLLGGAARRDFAITRGEPQWFQSSKIVRRGFCGQCGTPLFFDAPSGDSINVTLGSLDKPGEVEPVTQSNTGSKLAFSHRLDNLPVEAEAVSADWLATVAQATYQHPDHDTSEWPIAKDEFRDQ
jgi:hypothetical protein